MLTRRGFTLVELLIGLVLFGLVSAALYRVLVSNQRMYHAQTQRIDLQQNIRAAVTILPAELRELNALDGDIVAMAPTSLTVRATRQLALICTRPTVGPLAGNVAAVTLTIRDNPLFGMRDFNPATDSIFVYYEGDQATVADDGWVRGRITAIAPLNCADGAAGRQLTTSLVYGANQIAADGRIQNGSPLRGYETVTYSVYQAPDGRWYLGYQSTSTSDVRQPLIGPLLGGNGVSFEYFDRSGAVTADPLQVALIRVTLRAQTAAPVRTADGPLRYVTDSVVTRVALRNNRRWNTLAPGS